MEPWHYWIIAGLVLCILEMFTGDFVLLGLGIASVGSSFVAAGHASLNWQLAAFSCVSIIFIFGVRPVARRHFYKNSDPRPSNVKAMIGQTAIVVDTVAGGHGSGRVKLGSEEWRAISAPDSDDLTPGTAVRISGIDGSTLIVSSQTAS